MTRSVIMELATLGLCACVLLSIHDMRRLQAKLRQLDAAEVQLQGALTREADAKATLQHALTRQAYECGLADEATHFARTKLSDDLAASCAALHEPGDTPWER